MSRNIEKISDTAWLVALIRMTSGGLESTLTFTHGGSGTFAGSERSTDTESILATTNRLGDDFQVAISVNPRGLTGMERCFATLRVVAKTEARAASAAKSLIWYAPPTSDERQSAIRLAIRLRDDLWPVGIILADDDAYILVPLGGKPPYEDDGAKSDSVLKFEDACTPAMAIAGAEVDWSSWMDAANIPIRPEQPKWWPGQGPRRPFATELISAPRIWQLRVTQYLWECVPIGDRERMQAEPDQ